MRDPLAHRLARVPVPWDDVRQRRVLTRVEAAVERRARARRHGRWAAAATLMATAAAVVLVLLWPGAPSELRSPSTADPSGVAVAPVPSIPYARWPELRLPDDSVAELRHGAQVDVDVQEPERVRLRQRSGEVRYQVTPDRTRAFVVDAAGVEVRVVGTVFTVTLDDRATRVTVSVERGRVEVDDGARVAVLDPGDTLGLDVPEPDPEDEDEDEVVILDAEPTTARRPPASSPEPTPDPSVESLLAEADAARARGDLSRAAAALGELVGRHPRDPQAYGGLFQLGKVERARGRHAAAAAAFTTCWKRSPRGALAEDARAEAAISWQDAGRPDRARSTAEGYLRQYPGGTHQARMRRLLDDDPH